jgi:Mg-chelatase subunit ChlD
VWARVGTAVDNAAIDRVSARQIARSSATEVLVTVANHGTTALSGRLSLRAGIVEIGRQTVSLPPAGSTAVSFTVPSSHGVLTARLDVQDALTADNSRSLVVVPPSRIRVLLIDRGGGEFIQQALLAHPDVALTRDDGQKPGAGRLDGAYDVVVCVGCDSAPAGAERVVLVPARRLSDAAPVAMVARTPEHPLASGVELEGVIGRLLIDSAAPSRSVVVSAGDRPGVVAVETGSRRLVEIRVEPSGEFAVSAAFPVLIANALSWLTDRDRNPATLVAGDAVQWHVGPQKRPPTVAAPDGRSVASTFTDGVLSIGRLQTSGTYRVGLDQGERTLIVNPAAGAESDLARAFSQPDLPDVEPQRRAEPAFADLTAAFLVGALALLGVEWRYRVGRGSSGRRAGVRCLIAALLVLAISRVQIRMGEAPMTVAFAVDVSHSMGDTRAELLDRVEAMRRQLPRGDRASLTVFGSVPQAERAAADAGRAFAELTADVPGHATNLEAAIRMARSSLPAAGVRRIVVVTDGNETTGDAMREAALAAAQGIAIDLVPPTHEGLSSLRVAKLSAPAIVRPGQPFSVTAVVEGPPNAEGELQIADTGGRSVREPVVVGAGGAVIATLPATQSVAGAYVYTASVRESGPAASLVEPGAESSAGTVVVVAGEPRVLHVGARPGVFPALLPALLPAGGAMASSRIDHVVPGAVPASAEPLRSYDLVILDDVAADDLREQQLAAVAQHVKDSGAGLFVLGSPRSLEAGAFPDRPLGALLPIDLRQRSGQRAPELALVVVYDKSGSMDDRVDGAARIEFAREGIRKLVDVLPAGDALGVIAFDSLPTPVVPLGTARDARELAERLRAIHPGGSTAMAPAIELAGQWMAGLGAGRFPRRHVLLLSDGQSSAEDLARLQSVVKSRSFELSVVALGHEADRDFLTRLAESTGGRAYLPAHIRELPAILAREGARMAGGQVLEESFTLRTGSHALAGGLDVQTLPRMGGYVVSALKPGADAALRSHLDDPVMAVWSHGLGRVAVYTADLHGGWSASLRRWREWPTLVNRTMTWLARPASSDTLYTRIEPSGDAVRVVAEASTPDGVHVSALRTTASVRTPAGETIEVTLPELNPGRYEAAIPVTDIGPYLVTVQARGRDSFDSRALRGFYWSSPAETRERGVNHGLMARLAQASGGRVLQPGETVLTGRPPAYVDLREGLLITAFLLFLAEVLAGTLVRFPTRRGSRLPEKQAA